MTDTVTSPLRLSFGRMFPIFALTFVDVLGLTIILPLLHLYAARFGASSLEIGIVMAAFPVAQLIGVPVMGRLSDRYGRKPLLLISQVSTCIAFIMLGTANSLAMIILARVVDGILGANLATAQAAISDITTQETRAQGFGYLGAAFGLGFIFGPIISFVALEFTDNLGVPALIAAAYSFVSILITLFLFEETNPPARRAARDVRQPSSWGLVLRDRRIALLLATLFSEQVVFFAFESLLGLFILSRFGLLGQGSALYFLWAGVLLVMVQARGVGRIVRRYGERKTLAAALLILGFGLVLMSLTPAQAQPFYVQNRVERDLRAQSLSGTETVIGEINVPLPNEASRGVGGLLWLVVALIPISVGSALVRPCVNSLITKRVGEGRYGGALALSAATVSASNAIAPILGGALVQAYGFSVPFLAGGVWIMGIGLLATVRRENAEDAVNHAA